MNVVDVLLAGTVTDAGTVSAALLLERPTALPPVGAAWLRVTVHVAVAPEFTLVGLQTKAETSVEAIRLKVMLCEELPKVAETVPDWLVVIAAAVALKEVEVLLAGTVTDAGTVSDALLLESPTALPPNGAAWLSVTVQVLAAPEFTLVGVQASAETSVGAIRFKVALCEELPKVAVTVPDWLVVIAAAVALKVAEVLFAGTVTDAGTMSAVLLLESPTALPPNGAAWLRVTVQVLAAPEFTLVGVQASAETSVGAIRFKVALCEELPKVAVTVPDWLVVIAAAVALKEVEVLLAGTVTDAGTVSDALLLESPTALPPDGAAWLSVTVQVLAAPEFTLVGVQASAETSVGATRLKVALCEELPKVAVTVPDWLVVIAAAVALKVAEVLFAGTVTDAGTMSAVLLLESPTALPPNGAAWLRVTVQVLAAPEFTLVGVQASAETSVGAIRFKVALCEELPKFAVTVPDWLVVIAAAVALKVAEVLFAGTVTDAGTMSAVLLLESPTALPPNGAAWLSVTVQVLAAPEFTLVGVHARVETSVGATRLKVVFWEAPFRTAVIVADWVAVMVPAVALKVVEVLFAGTVTDAGTVSAVLLLESPTVLPPAGAASFKLIV